LRVLAALLLAVLAAAPAAAQTELLPGYADKSARGPAKAKGAIIYSHGLARVAEASSEMPFIVDSLEDSGWDVYRLQRRWAEDILPASVAVLSAALKKLRADGYARVVLVGQSFGGWISLAVASGSEPVHAVVAFAPAAFGTRNDSANWTQNADGLYELAEAVKAERTLVFLFDNDEFDPGERGERLREIFDRRDIAAQVVDRPFGLAGHGAGLSRGFARRFGPCLRDYVETTSPAPRFVCGGEPPAVALQDFALPEGGVHIQPPSAGAPASLTGMLGRWYGIYPSGREVLLVVEEVGQDRARAIYSFGPLFRHVENHVGYTPRRGEFNSGTGVLSFTEPHISSDLQARLAPDGRIDFTWINRQTGGRLTARLRKLD
jgi:pimeloyl-ACP methyl ester carboxylesterase